jgi:hypothetical protein
MTQTNVRELKFEGFSFGSVKGGKFGFYQGEKKAIKAPTAPLTSWIFFFVQLLGTRSPLRVEASKLAECFVIPIHTVNTNSRTEVLQLQARLERAGNGRHVLSPAQRKPLLHGENIVLGSITFQKVSGDRWTIHTADGGPLKVGPEIMLNLACIALRDEWVRERLPAYHVPWAPSLKSEYWEGDQPRRELLELDQLPDGIWERSSGNAEGASGGDSGEKLETSTPLVTPKPSTQSAAAKLLRALLDVERCSHGNQDGPVAAFLNPLMALVQAVTKALTDAGVQPAPGGVSTAALDEQAELLFAKHADILRGLLRDEIAKAEAAKNIAYTHIESLNTLASTTEADVKKAERERNDLKEEKKEWAEFVQGQATELDQREAAVNAREAKVAQGEAALQQAQAASAKDLLKSLKKGSN